MEGEVYIYQLDWATMSSLVNARAPRLLFLEEDRRSLATSH